MTTFMKPDDYVPTGLLCLPPALPAVMFGLGDFKPYDTGLRTQVCVERPGCCPKRQSAGAAGFDLLAIEDVIVPARGSAIVDTGVSLALPAGHYGRVTGRSSLAFKYDVTAFEGTIDEDYRSSIKVKLFNHSDTTFKTGALSRIAQLIVQPVVAPRFDVVKILPDTDRGVRGFGSTDSI